jgi:hypothetical protein
MVAISTTAISTTLAAIPTISTVAIARTVALTAFGVDNSRLPISRMHTRRLPFGASRKSLWVAITHHTVARALAVSAVIAWFRSNRNLLTGTVIGFVLDFIRRIKDIRRISAVPLNRLLVEMVQVVTAVLRRQIGTPNPPAVFIINEPRGRNIIIRMHIRNVIIPHFRIAHRSPCRRISDHNHLTDGNLRHQQQQADAYYLQRNHFHFVPCQILHSPKVAGHRCAGVTEGAKWIAGFTGGGWGCGCGEATNW